MLARKADIATNTSSPSGTPIACSRWMPETAPHEVQTLIDDLYTKHLATDRGEVATYIPELSKV